MQNLVLHRIFHRLTLGTASLSVYRRYDKLRSLFQQFKLTATSVANAARNGVD
jgi:hypothetical protein